MGTPDGGADMLSRYLGELSYLQTAGAAFASKYPNVASQLELGSAPAADPQVQRLIESFAFLTARLQRQYDARFPEIPAALLDLLYPQLTAPVPSVAIAAFRPDPQQSRSVLGVTLPAGTQLFATAAEEAKCRFRTCYPATLWPLQVADVAVEPASDYTFLDQRTDVSAVLRLRLQCLGNRRLAEFTPSSLRLFLHGSAMTRFPLYELLLNQLRGIMAVPQTGDGAAGAPMHLVQGKVQPVGFEASEAVLPYPSWAHQGYRLVQEYFSVPDKFLFIDLEGVSEHALGTGTHADILFLLAKRPPQRFAVGPDTIQLGCVPIINLFERTSEPIRLDQTRIEYRLVPDQRWEAYTEIHSVQRVSRSSVFEDDTHLLSPFFSFTHADAAADRHALWISRRQPVPDPALGGTEIMLSFVDPELKPAEPAASVVFAHTLCTNRGLAAHIAPGTPLQIEVDAPLRDIVCLTRPTPQLDPPLAGETLWRLISHLTVNHLSLEEGPDSLAALREILLLYSGNQDSKAAGQISGLSRLSTRRVMRRVGQDAWRGFCRGLEVTLEFDEAQFVGSSAYLLGAILDRFFGLYAAVNSFTQLVTTSRQREGIWKQWPARTGDALVL